MTDEALSFRFGRVIKVQPDGPMGQSTDTLNTPLECGEMGSILIAVKAPYECQEISTLQRRMLIYPAFFSYNKRI
ncbi:uncharacterized protein PHALS_02669 [Plasmopara halstedii]|uniref:Uncharacterized protein n=1 Tax=Plasmopara halstedii TaxID=4781 RepID=A0A0P1AY39_PLAHL|nr:uncharacterized protein PHALS_02669 [Plasmopara halstedii]CEG46258.1 hypothetical protein PHALS_02669 [Plasmopara halstedii]|eukprot:XP_024582627.1 hypothetical protein PHALS_02669 [Plasmopara halstedii]